jgi:hypothetical protein
MTKQHFIALADTIRTANKGNPENNPLPFESFAIETLADFCAAQNPAFNRSRWLDYIAGKVGPNGGAK